MESLVKDDPRAPPGSLDHVRIGVEDPGLVALGFAMKSFPMLMDMEMRLLVAPAGTEFITSDNPVVKYNKLLGDFGIGSNTGFACKGLVLFFPINALVTLILYDSGSYHFGPSKAADIALASPRDVHELNVLQAVSASENVYLRSSAANVFKVVESAKAFRRRRLGFVKVVAEEQNAKGKSTLIQTSNENVRTDAQLNFLRVHKQASRWFRDLQGQRRIKAVFLRDEELMRRFEAHQAAVQRGTASQEGVILAMYGREVVDQAF